MDKVVLSTDQKVYQTVAPLQVWDFGKNDSPSFSETASTNNIKLSK